MNSYIFSLFSVSYHIACPKVNLGVSLFKDTMKKRFSATYGSIHMLSPPLSFFQPGHIDKIVFVWVRQSRRLYTGSNVYHPKRRPEETF